MTAAARPGHDARISPMTRQRPLSAARTWVNLCGPAATGG